jgi:NADH-quinone oxidoreductase subunit J
MTPIQGVFLITAAAILWSAYMVVTRDNLIHSALYLIITLFGVAVLFVLLEAGFLAVVQVLVYIGAIAILMIFAVMLTRGDVDKLEQVSIANSGWVGMISILFFSTLILLMGQWPAFNSVVTGQLDSGRDTVVELGTALVSPNGYVIPFEVASVLLLAALIGALYVARPQGKGK